MLPATLPTGRSLVMGILNVTPDSFSDGGLYVDTDVAVERAYRMVRQGADIVDVGGESTRPGATALTAREEWNRIGAVVTALGKTDIVVSVDTYHADTARRAIDAGAEIVNDVTGGAGDPNMFSAVASSSCLYILQHGRGNARTMNSLADYGDIGAEVADELSAAPVIHIYRAGIKRFVSAVLRRAADAVHIDERFFRFIKTFFRVGIVPLVIGAEKRNFFVGDEFVRFRRERYGNIAVLFKYAPL